MLKVRHLTSSADSSLLRSVLLLLLLLASLALWLAARPDLHRRPAAPPAAAR
jgi:hypothetical protein